MFIPRLYYPHPLVINDVLTLDKTLSHYLINVLHARKGETVILFNGQGGEYLAHIETLAKTATVKLLAFNDLQRESCLQLHLGQALVRGDRMDLVIQKATELGVTAITPLVTAKCAVKLTSDRLEKRLQHWINISISAAEQSGRTQLPIIHAPVTLTQWVTQSFTGTSILLAPGTPLSLKNIALANSLRLAIGPESGWDSAEVELMLAQGFTACHLGPRILRTETAGMTALSILQALFGDL